MRSGGAADVEGEQGEGARGGVHLGERHALVGGVREDGVARAVVQRGDAAAGQQPKVGAVRTRPTAPAYRWRLRRARRTTGSARSLSAGSRPDANWPPHHSTVTGWSRSHGSAALASATACSRAARACSTGSSSATPSRPSATSRSGTVEAQSPACTRPIESG